jgi:DNA-binding IclR family transcriptional regulator
MKALAERVHSTQMTMTTVLRGLEEQGLAEPNTGGTWALTPDGQPFGVAALDGLQLLGDSEERPRYRSRVTRTRLGPV